MDVNISDWVQSILNISQKKQRTWKEISKDKNWKAKNHGKIFHFFLSLQPPVMISIPIGHIKIFLQAFRRDPPTFKP